MPHRKGQFYPPHPTAPTTPPPDRVLCTVLVIIRWARPPSLIEFHLIDNYIITVTFILFNVDVDVNHNEESNSI